MSDWVEETKHRYLNELVRTCNRKDRGRHTNIRTLSALLSLAKKSHPRTFHRSVSIQNEAGNGLTSGGLYMAMRNWIQAAVVEKAQPRGGYRIAGPFFQVVDAVMSPWD